MNKMKFSELPRPIQDLLVATNLVALGRDLFPPGTSPEAATRIFAAVIAGTDVAEAAGEETVLDGYRQVPLKSRDFSNLHQVVRAAKRELLYLDNQVLPALLAKRESLAGMLGAHVERIRC